MKPEQWPEPDLQNGFPPLLMLSYSRFNLGLVLTWVRPTDAADWSVGASELVAVTDMVTMVTTVWLLRGTSCEL